MKEERYMVFRKENRLWGVDTLVLSGVVQDPVIENVPFVPGVIRGLFFFKKESVPVLNISVGDGLHRILIIIESIFGKVGIMACEILGIFNREEIIDEEKSDLNEHGIKLGKLNGEDVFYFDLKIINDFFKDIEIKN